MVNIAINGFGRIGRMLFKLALENNLKVVAINDLQTPESAAYLLKYDSIYGRYEEDVTTNGHALVVNGKKIPIVSEQDPARLPWKKLGVDVVLEATGRFTDREGASKHLKAGAKKVIITAPARNPDITLVPGVNDKALKKEHRIISLGSCTTNCTAPVVKVLDDAFGIKHALLTTIHAYTNDQATHDMAHKKLRRGRAAALNMVPTTTGAAESVIEVLPQLKGKMTGMAIRVPIACGSLIDLTAELKKTPSVNEINKLFKKLSSSSMKGIISYNEDEIVSSDIIKDSHSAIFDATLTQALGAHVKVFAWYDNEYAYSKRVIDVIEMLR